MNSFQYSNCPFPLLIALFTLFVLSSLLIQEESSLLDYAKYELIGPLPILGSVRACIPSAEITGE